MADNDGKFGCFLVGLGMGIMVGLLYAPRTGEETRELLTHKADEGREFVKRRSRELRDQADDYIAKGKDTAARQKENLQSAVDAGKRAYRDASEPSGSKN